MKTKREYEIPTLLVVAMDADDVLTSSGDGFDGEEHSLLPTNFLR